MKPTQTAAATDTTTCETMLLPARTERLSTRANGERIGKALQRIYRHPFEHRFGAQLRLIEGRGMARPRLSEGVAVAQLPRFRRDSILVRSIFKST